MRTTFGSVAAIAFSIAVCAGCNSSKTDAEAGPPAPKLERITAVGCPEAGPAPNCLIIKSKGKAYDLATANPAVDMSRGVGISLTGHASTETTDCGIKLADMTYDYLGIQCAAPAPEPTPPA